MMKCERIGSCLVMGKMLALVHSHVYSQSIGLASLPSANPTQTWKKYTIYMNIHGIHEKYMYYFFVHEKNTSKIHLKNMSQNHLKCMFFALSRLSWLKCIHI